MKNLIKLIIVSILFSSSLFAEDIKIDDVYEVYITKTNNIDLNNIIKKENIFFGKYNDWIKKETERIKTLNQNISNGAISGLSSASNGVVNSIGNATGKSIGQGLGMGLGIGLVYGLIEISAKNIMEDEVFIIVNDITNLNGDKTRVFGILCANNFNNETIIKSFLEQEINKKFKL